MNTLTRRSALALLGSPLLTQGARADTPVIRIAINLPLTGGEAQSAGLIKDGALMAIDDVNARGGAGGFRLEPLLMDDGTATSAGYDPAQAATNARRMVTDPQVLAAIGPMNSGSGKAMSPILSQASLAIITPSSTNPDITNPSFAAVYRPAGPAIYFRTVTTDAFQGPNMANFYVDVLKVANVFVLDDSGAYGVGLADAFQQQAEKRGLKVLGRDRLDPLAADYSPVLTKIKSLNAAALYFGGNPQAGVKVVKQSYDIVPQIPKGGGDGVYEPDMLSGGGFPAIEGWYATIAAPHDLASPAAEQWVKRFADRFGQQPQDYSLTAYDGVLVIADAIGRTAKGGVMPTRAALRAAIEATSLETLQGKVEFDPNGDLKSHIVSVFQVHHDPAYPVADMLHQWRYIGVAPEANA
ncbi:MAG: branched-chain amino acid ABC transporter substrate-binding protein [Acidisphaera sp.]|nr:branched-chain amino acid ABC transporter substrate-binding protein [Acidisphaera sp.]